MRSVSLTYGRCDGIQVPDIAPCQICNPVGGRYNILLNFLNAILYGGQDTIQSLTILDPDQAPQLKGMKDSFLDVKAILHNKTSESRRD